MAKRRKHKRTTAEILDAQDWPTVTGAQPVKSWSWKPKTCVQLHIGQRFELDGGLFILASAYRDTTGKHNQTQRDLGFYLDEDWANRAGDNVLTTAGVDFPRPSRQPMVLYPWPDYGKPTVTMRAFDQAVSWLMHKIERGVVVETGCYGGHGRTGTLLAALLVKQGVEAMHAIARVRLTYCDWAIESSSQEHFVRAYGAWLNGEPMPPREGSALDHEPSVIVDTPGWETLGDAEKAAFLAATDDDTEMYEAWLRDNTWAEGASVPSAYHDESWEDFMHSEGLPLPDDWFYMDDVEIEEHLKKYGWTVVTEADAAEDCVEPPCPHPAACAGDDCLRNTISERSEA